MNLPFFLLRLDSRYTSSLRSDDFDSLKSSLFLASVCLHLCVAYDVRYLATIPMRVTRVNCP